MIPVLLLNVILYRRRFSPHKYLVVALVTVGISLFMLMAETSGKKKGGQNSTWGLGLLGFKWVPLMLYSHQPVHRWLDQLDSRSAVCASQIVFRPTNDVHHGMYHHAPSHPSALSSIADPSPVHPLPSPLPSICKPNSCPSAIFTRGAANVAQLSHHPPNSCTTSPRIRTTWRSRAALHF